MKPSSLHLRILAAAAAVTLASGCVTRPPAPTNGNLAAATPDVEIALANEAGDFLRGTYPPASTEFGIAQAVDPFSKRLKSVLRRSGYAVAAEPPMPTPSSSRRRCGAADLLDRPTTSRPVPRRSDRGPHHSDARLLRACRTRLPGWSLDEESERRRDTASRIHTCHDPLGVGIRRASPR
jgi:hypothetical protein